MSHNSLANKLGFESYEAYLMSPLWKEIKARVIKLRGSRCEFCKSVNYINIHHLIYTEDILRGKGKDKKFKKHFRVLCRNCHKKIHTGSRGGSIRNRTLTAERKINSKNKGPSLKKLGTFAYYQIKRKNAQANQPPRSSSL